jgi:hypothetical protein
MKIRVLLTWVGVVTLLQWTGPYTVAGENAERSISRGRSTESLRKMIVNSASKQGVDPTLVEAIIAVESAFNPMAVSVKGAMGLMQLMPQTASHYGVADPFDPKQNVSGGIRYLRDLLLRFENLIHALAAYNAGENAVLKYRGLPPYRETHDYVKKVLDRYGPGQEYISSSSVLFLGQVAGETIRALERAKILFQRLAMSRNESRGVSAGSRTKRLTVPRTTTRRPLTQLILGSPVEIKPLRRNSVQLRVYHRQ